MRNLVFLLEEESAKCMLEILLKRHKTSFVNVKYICFQGKQDLDRNIERKIKYWQTPNTTFIILRDQDSADCIALKHNLENKLKDIANYNVDRMIVRIACHELESFYLGDLLAVEQGFEIKGLAKHQNKKKYKEPDKLNNAKQELKNITNNKYQQLKGSRTIA